MGILSTLDKDGLTRAHVGAGGGKTALSDSRETLSRNMFIDWSKKDIMTEVSTRTFDLASELYGEEIPYEGQEPINFLHYLKGFEYKTHSDGAGEAPGKRVATTLVYCEAATEGGATVFPTDNQNLKVVPRTGDLLFFTYQPNPNWARHAACPVGKGSKSTLTQWHRLGVSTEQPWDNFEAWGKFHNPHGTSEWKGSRYSSRRSEL